MFYISLSKQFKTNNKMGRYSIEEQEKKKPFAASVKKKIIDSLGLLTCKEIAENAVNKEYEKRLKNQSK